MGEEELSLLMKFYENYFLKYDEIILILEEFKYEDGLSRISQNRIADIMKVSPSQVSKCIQRLIRSDNCIEKVKPGVYKINQTDLLNYGPYKVFRKYLYFSVFTDDFLNKSWDEKAMLVGVNKDEIIMAASYFNMFIHEYKEQLEKSVNDIEEKVNNIKLKEVF